MGARLQEDLVERFAGNRLGHGRPELAAAGAALNCPDLLHLGNEVAQQVFNAVAQRRRG